jgi:hypothetical protein
MPATIVLQSDLPPVLLYPRGRGYDWTDIAITLKSAPNQWVKILLKELPGKDTQSKKQFLRNAMRRRGITRLRTDPLGLHLFFRELTPEEKKK